MTVRFFLLCLLAPGLLGGQAPRIGIIDFYGLRKVSEKQIREVLGVKEGDALPPSKADVEERMEQVRGVVRARLEAVCCDDGKAILFVGIEERGAPHFSFRRPPDGEVALPEEIVQTYHRLLTVYEQLVRKGDAAEDWTRGHALAANPDARALQERLLAYADGQVTTLRDVLRNSADSEQRAIAAYVIAYAPKKSLVVNDLQYAMQDPNDSVRNNAMRALGAITVLASRDPELGIQVSPTWFIEMLNSILWTDRNKATSALVNLTESRDPKTLDQLRERAFPSLIEMARWKSLGHALPAFILLGRVAGVEEQEILDAWSTGEREALVARIVESGQTKK
jgi:hypothetical protein